MTRTLASLALTALIIATGPIQSAQSASAPTHPFGGADWQRLARAAPRAVAPDGRTILVEETHGQSKGTDIHVWYTLAIDGSGRHLLHLPKSFVPFGFAGSAHSLYGTFDVKDAPQFARWTIGAHTAPVIARIASGISAIVPSNDGARYALLADPRPAIRSTRRAPS